MEENTSEVSEENEASQMPVDEVDAANADEVGLKMKKIVMRKI